MSNLTNQKIAIQICEMFYFEGLSQKEIAAKLGISRPKICRIMQFAKDSGLVSIKINYPNSWEKECEQKLKDKYNLSDAIVFDTGNSKGIDEIKTLAERAADLFLVFAKDGFTIGVMAGRTVHEFAKALTVSRDRGLSFIPLVGGDASNGCDWFANSNCQLFGEKTKGRYYFLNTPSYLKNIEAKQLLIQEPGIKEILEKGRNCDMAVLGIGTIDRTSSAGVAGRLTEDDIAQLVSDGAVGSICTTYVDSEGNQIKNDVTDKFIGQNIFEMKRSYNIAVASGIEKVNSIRAVLKSGTVNALITSLATAELL